MPDVAYVSPLIRARQTAEIFFPGCPQIIVQDLREMCFGSFEGRHYIHIEHDPDYLAWLEANKTAARPDGERIQDFCNRSCVAFAKLVEESLAQHKQQLVIVAHGGIQMAVMSRYGLPRRDYHDWCGPNAGGYRLDAANWQTDHTLQLLETVQYTKATQSEAALCAMA